MLPPIAVALDRSNFMLWRALTLPNFGGVRLHGFLDGSAKASALTVTTGTCDAACTVSNPECEQWWTLDQKVSPNPYNHYYWENGEDNYVDFLVRNGYLGTASGTVVGDIASEETEQELEEAGLEKMADVVKKMDLVVKKMDELLEICRNVFSAILFLIAVMLYVAVAK
ncbi:hypothetical protein ZWY2020_011179 [Hordeum vulgare]|nr:hypothetical protein ZWY2020_011179 [Hordeum vulgare]